MVPVLRRWTFRLHRLPSAAVSAALTRGHAALAFVDVGVGFADRAAVVVAVGFSQDLWVLRYRENWLQHVQRMDTNRIPKQALQYKSKGRRNIERPRKRWRDLFHFEDQGTGNTPNPS